MNFNKTNILDDTIEHSNGWFLMKLSTIKKWIYINVLWIISWASLSIWSNIYFDELVNQDNDVIDIIWKQRMLTQKIAKDIIFEEKHCPKSWDFNYNDLIYKQNVETFNNNLNVLLEWWNVVSDLIGDRIINIKPIEDPLIREKLFNIQEKWDDTYEWLIMEDFLVKKEYLEEVNIELLDDINDVIIEFINWRDELKELKGQVELVILMLTLTFLWFVTKVLWFDLLRKLKNDEEEKSNLLKNIHKLNVELEKKYIEAEKAKEDRTIFMAHTVHELRKPLSPIVVNAENIISDSGSMSSQEIVDSWDVILKSAQRFWYILNNFLDFSKFDKWEVVLDESRFDIFDLVWDIRKQFSDEILKKWLELDLDIDSKNGNFVVEWDFYRIKQIISNIISNAVKFTDEWKISLSILNIDQKLIIKVTDTWIGMDEKWINDLFIEFKQADNSIERKYQWTWLEMAITKKIIDKIWGEIFVHSELWSWTSI